MGNFFNQLRERVMTFFNGLSRNRKIMLIAGILAAVLLLTTGILMLTRTEYVVIAQGLTPVEAQNVTSQLTELGIPWRDSNNTSTILVPEADVSRARMELAVSAASGAISWVDVFNNDSITMTSQTREQMMIQASAAQIEKSIETITVVDNATVILQIPKESNYFIKDEIESKASVVLNIKNGMKLNDAQVSGIVNLIVSSVKDLKPENVTILDSSGIQLNNQESTDGFTANTQYDLQQRVQRQMKSDLTAFLEKIYGKGNVEVQPNLALDFNQQVETVKLFSPPIEGEINGMVRSATRITENVINDAGAQGIPGTDSNTGEATSVVEGANAGASYEKASETLNYELNEIYREIVSSQGDIKSLSIGVLVNSNALVDNAMTDTHRNELINLIAMSAGTDRGNIQILVQQFPDPMEFYDVYTAEDTSGTLFGIPIVVIVIVALVTLVAVIGVMLLLRRNRQKREEAEAEAARQAAIQERTLDEIEFQEDKGSPKYHIEKFVDNNPEAAASLLRAWLNES